MTKELECLRTNKICSLSNLKCKECKLTDCKSTMELIEREEKMLFETKEDIFRKKLKKEYPQCVNCSHLQILSIDKGKVFCPYMIKRCGLK